MSLCEVCEKPIVGEPIVHPDEGDSYCAWCVVALIGAERDELKLRLADIAATVADADALLDDGGNLADAGVMNTAAQNTTGRPCDRLGLGLRAACSGCGARQGEPCRPPSR